MIRKMFIVILVTLGAGCLTAWISTLVLAPDYNGRVWGFGPCRFSNHDGKWCVTAYKNGHLRVYLPIYKPQFAVTLPFDFKIQTWKRMRTIPRGANITVKQANTPTTMGLILSGPIWLSALLLLIYPALVFYRSPLRRWRRGRKGLCLKCGYNLTGNTTGVCSECGTGIPS